MKRSTQAVALFSACLAGYLVWRATAAGLCFTPDGRAYLDAAHSFAASGRLWIHDACGVRSWMTHFPPLFPVLVGIGLRTGFDAFAFTRILNVACAACSAAAVAVIVTLVADSAPAGLLAGTALALLPDFVTGHRSFLSDPVFLALLLWGFLTLFLAIRRESHRLLFTAGVLLGLACCARFAALPFVPAGVLAVWLFRRGTRPVLLFLLPVATSPVLVALLNAHYSDAWSDRHLLMNKIGFSYWAKGLATTSAWFQLGWLAPSVQVILTAAAILAVSVALARGIRPGPMMAILFGSFYILFLLAARLFTDEGVELENRYLLPVFCLMLVTVAGMAPRAGVLCGLLALAALHFRSAAEAPSAVAARYNSNHPAWSQSETLGYVASLTGQKCYYGSRPDVLDLQLGKPSGWLPGRQTRDASGPAADWCRETLQDLSAKRRPAAFVFLDVNGSDKKYQVTEPELARCLNGADRVRLRDGTVLVVR